MAGTLTISTLSDGTNSTSSTNCIQGSAKAWVNFDGTTSPGTIRASYNVGSVTKNSTGNYTVNFTTAFADNKYVTNSTSRRSDFADPQGIATVMGGSTYASVATTTSVQLAVGYTSNGSFVNFDYIGVAVFR